MLQNIIKDDIVIVISTLSESSVHDKQSHWYIESSLGKSSQWSEEFSVESSCRKLLMDAENFWQESGYNLIRTISSWSFPHSDYCLRTPYCW